MADSLPATKDSVITVSPVNLGAHTLRWSTSGDASTLDDYTQKCAFDATAVAPPQTIPRPTQWGAGDGIVLLSRVYIWESPSLFLTHFGVCLLLLALWRF
jgi:hypothetical protein